MQYGPAAVAVAELPYSAMIASFVLVVVWAAVAAGDEPNISEAAGAVVCIAAAGVAERKSAKGSVSTGCDGGEMSVTFSHAHIHTTVK